MAPSHGFLPLQTFQRVLRRLVELKTETMTRVRTDDFEMVPPLEEFAVNEKALQTLTALHLDVIVGKDIYALEKDALYTQLLGTQVDVASYERGLMVHDNAEHPLLIQAVFLAALSLVCAEEEQQYIICTVHAFEANLALMLIQDLIDRLLQEEHDTLLFANLQLPLPVYIQKNDTKIVLKTAYAKRVSIWANQFTPAALRGRTAHTMFYHNIYPGTPLFNEIALPMMQVRGRKSVFFADEKWDYDHLQGMKPV